MQGQGLKLNTKAFVAQLIEDMRKTAQTWTQAGFARRRLEHLRLSPFEGSVSGRSQEVEMSPQANRLEALKAVREAVDKEIEKEEGK